MKPMARVLISRQRLYEKNCNQDEGNSGGGGGGSSPGCETGPWGDWDECNTKCGKGKKLRQRSYLDRAASIRNSCKTKLTQRQNCQGTDCDEHETEEDDKFSNDNNRNNERVQPECALRPFTEWSGCSSECGKGIKVRTRKYVSQKAKKACERGSATPPKLEETAECDGTECGGDIPMSVVVNKNCKTTVWSQFTQCSVTCGLGKQTRSKKLINRGYGIQRYGVHPGSPTYEKIYGVKSKNRHNNNNSNEDDEDENEDDEIESIINDPAHPCYNAVLHEEVDCHNPPCDDDGQLQTAPEYCRLPPRVGNCRANPSMRWYFSKNNICALFAYSGCGGNKNNFDSLEDCESNCKIGDFQNLQVRDQHKIEEKIDCQVTNWIRGPCNVTCGSGFRIKTRTVVTHPLNGGRHCPRKFKRFERCEVKCGPNYDTNPSWGPTAIQGNELVNCEYSHWSLWSPCSQTCGNSAKQQRTRYVTNSEYALYCNDRLETRSCNAMPCLL